MGPTESPGASSTSPARRSRGSRRRTTESSRSSSRGEDAAGGGLRALASRHGVRPTKVLGQNFLTDPNLARAIAADAGVGRGDRVLEIGAGLGSLTVALAERGADVLALELDRSVLRALDEVVVPLGVRVERADAMTADWASLLGDAPRWACVSNLPYNVAVPVVMRLLEEAPTVDPIVVMVQREVGERLAAAPGDPAYGSVSARVAYRAEAKLVRRVPATVFWPRPRVESVVVRLDRRPPPVEVPPARLFPVIEAGFAQRRKTMRNALLRLGMAPESAAAALDACGIAADARAEQLGLPEFACLAEHAAPSPP